MPRGRIKTKNFGSCSVCGNAPRKCREMCNVCYGRWWRSKNAEHYKAYHKAYEAKRREDPKRKSYSKKISREFYLRNRDKIIARTKARYRANTEKWREQERKWIIKNREKKRAAWRRWDARKRGSGGNGISAKDWDDIKDVWGNACAYCGDKSSHLTQDHVIPLSRGGQDEIGNVVPACKSCNSSKGNKLLSEWKIRFRSSS